MGTKEQTHPEENITEQWLKQKKQNNVEINLAENHILQKGEQVCSCKTLKSCFSGYAQPSKYHTKVRQLKASPAKYQQPP